MSDGMNLQDFRCTVFSGKDDRVGALLMLAILDPLIEIVGPEETWQQIVMFNSSGKLTFKALTRLDDGFAPLIAEMQQRFTPVPTVAVAAKQQVLDALRECQLAVEVRGEPLVRRLDQIGPVLGLARYLDGLICTGSTMADSTGNVVFDTDGHSDNVP
jgi:hypothetical protein